MSDSANSNEDAYVAGFCSIMALFCSIILCFIIFFQYMHGQAQDPDGGGLVLINMDLFYYGIPIPVLLSLLDILRKKGSRWFSLFTLILPFIVFAVINLFVV